MPTDPTGAPAETDYIRTMLRDVEAEAHVGLYPWERHPERPSRLIVSVGMTARRTGRADRGQGILDYDPIRQAIRSWRNLPHTDLLETLAEDLLDLCFRNPRVEVATVSILKPDIFNEAAGAGIEIRRSRSPRDGARE
jgi:dihydroneopterin aldolase